MRAKPLLLISLLSVALLSCSSASSPEYLRSIAEGQRAFSAGRYEEARAAYSEAAKKADRVKDRDEALFLEARTFERLEKWHDAIRCYGELAKASEKGPRTARAEFAISEIHIDHLNPQNGYRMLEQAIYRYPNHGLAQPSAKRLLDHVEEQQGIAGRLSWLNSALGKVGQSELAEFLSYDMASALERDGNHTSAHDWFLRTATEHPYPKGRLTDDSLFHAARLDEARGKYDEAIEHLQTLLGPREVSTTMGSYERPRYSEAQLHIAVLYRDRIKDLDRAHREFAKVYESHETSILRDDALFQDAVLAHSRKDESLACRLAEKLARDFSESRYAACAPKLCASLAPAKRECAEYIARELSN